MTDAPDSQTVPAPSVTEPPITRPGQTVPDRPTAPAGPQGPIQFNLENPKGPDPDLPGGAAKGKKPDNPNQFLYVAPQTPSNKKSDVDHGPIEALPDKWNTDPNRPNDFYAPWNFLDGFKKPDSISGGTHFADGSNVSPGAGGQGTARQRTI